MGSGARRHWLQQGQIRGADTLSRMSMGDEARARVSAEEGKHNQVVSQAEAHYLELKSWLDEFSREFAREAIKYPYVRPDHRQAGTLPPTWFERLVTNAQPKVWEVAVDWCHVADSNTDLILGIDVTGSYTFLRSSDYYLKQYRAGGIIYIRELYDKARVRQSFVRRLERVVSANG